MFAEFYYLPMGIACCNVWHFVYQFQNAQPRVTIKVNIQSQSQIHMAMAEHMETQTFDPITWTGYEYLWICELQRGSGREESSHHTDIHSTFMHFSLVFDQRCGKLGRYQIESYQSVLEVSPHQSILSAHSEITWNRLIASPSTHKSTVSSNSTKNYMSGHTDDLTLHDQSQYIDVDLWAWRKL